MAGRPAPSVAVPPPDRRLKKRPTGRWRPTTNPPSGAPAQRRSPGWSGGDSLPERAVLVRISPLSHRRGQENGPRQHVSRTPLGEVRRPDEREGRGQEGCLTRHPRGSRTHSHLRGTAGQRQAARAPAPRNTSPSSPPLSPPFSMPGETPFVTPDDGFQEKQRPVMGQMKQNKDLHVETTPPYCGGETKNKGIHPSLQ